MEKQTIALHQIEGQYDVHWYSIGSNHIVLYGLQRIKYDRAQDAAKAFGNCVHHQAECAGRLDSALLAKLNS